MPARRARWPHQCGADIALAWTSSSGKGKTDETLRQTQLLAQGNLTIKAVDGLQIDYKHLGQKDVSQAIDAMVQADPNLAWLKEAEQRGDVDWRAVKELHDSYSYSHSGMGQGTALVIAIIVTYLTWGAGSSLVGVAADSATGLAANSVVSAVATNASTSFINNRGNLGDVWHDTTSSDALKGYAISGITAGVTAGYFDKLTGTFTDPTTGKITFTSGVGLASVEGASRFAANQALQNLTSTAFSKVLGQGGNFGDALKDSLYNTFAAAGFNAIGDLGQKYHLETGGAQMVVMHALMGGLAAEARGDSFASGAAAAGLNEALVADLDKLVSSYSPQNREALLTMSSQLTGLIGAIVQNPDASERDLNTAAWVAKNSTQYNYLLHEEIQERAKEINGCGGVDGCEQEVIQRYAALDKTRNDDLPGLCQANPNQCMAIMKQLASERGLNDAAIDSIRFENINAAIGLQLASESNEEAISTIQLELIRHKYGEGTAIAVQVFQIAAAGNLVKNAKVAGVSKGSSLPTPNATFASNGLVYKSNPKHTLGQPGNRPNAGIEPQESLKLFEQSISSSKIYPNKEVRFAVDGNGNVHRFEGTNGEYHWNGSSGDSRNPLAGSQIPSDIQKQLGVRVK